MDFGVSVNQMIVRNIKAIIRWIKNLGMEFMNGKMDGSTRVTLKTTIVMVTENSMKEILACIEDFGTMENNLIDRSQLEKYLQKAVQVRK